MLNPKKLIKLPFLKTNLATLTSEIYILRKSRKQNRTSKAKPYKSLLFFKICLNKLKCKGKMNVAIKTKKKEKVVFILTKLHKQLTKQINNQLSITINKSIK